jgi:hypothetical protein
MLCAAVLGAKMAQAEGFFFSGGTGNNGNSRSSFKINFSANSGSHNQFKNGSNFNRPALFAAQDAGVSAK